MADPDSDSVLDAAGKTFVLAFDLSGSQIAAMPGELSRVLEMPDVQSAIQLALANFALAKQKSGTTEVSGKRWAEFHKASRTPAKKAGRKGKRKMSAEGRERIADARRKRWAAFRRRTLG